VQNAQEEPRKIMAHIGRQSIFWGSTVVDSPVGPSPTDYLYRDSPPRTARLLFTLFTGKTRELFLG